MNKTLAIFLGAAALALCALWARNHEAEAVLPPPRPAPVAVVVRTAAPAPAMPVAAGGAPEPEPWAPTPQVRRRAEATLELWYGDDDSAELGVEVGTWPVGTNLWAWTMPYSNGPGCDTGTLTFDESTAVILGEVTKAGQRFPVAAEGALHGVVVGVDAADALARLKSLLASPVEANVDLEVPGVLTVLQGNAPGCEEPGC